MGMGGISIWQLLIVLAIVLIIFGRKINFKNIGSDLGGAIKGFKKSMKDGSEDDKKIDNKDDVIEVKAVKEEDKKEK